MTTTAIYGIKNCDTMKKAIAWMDANDITYTFHDYKKQDVDELILNQAINEHGWEIVINKRGTTWRNLTDTVKNSMNDEKAVNIGTENPSVIKRPLLVHKGTTHIGFKSDEYESIFK